MWNANDSVVVDVAVDGDGDGVGVYHVDAYRLRRDDEARDLGFDEMLAEERAVVLIEWPERLGAAATRLDHHLRLAYGPDARTRDLTW